MTQLKRVLLFLFHFKCNGFRLCITSLMIPGQIIAQNSSDKFILFNYNDLHGLPQNSVKGIYEDELGFVWLATENGVVRYDGIHFDVFGNTQFPFLRSNRVGSITTAPDGNGVYAHFQSGELLQIKNGRLHPVSAPLKIHQRGLPSLKTATPDDINEIVYSGTDYLIGASQWDNRFVILLKNPGSYLFYENQKIHYFENWKKKRTTPYKHSLYDRLFVLQSRVFARDSSGTFFTLRTDDGIVRTNVKVTGDLAGDKDYLRDPAKLSIYWSNFSDPVYFNVERRLYEASFEKNTLTTRLVIPDFDFKQNHIKTVFFSKRNNIFFLGSPINGLFLLKDRNFRTAIPPALTKESVYAQAIFDSTHVVTPTGDLIEIAPGNKQPSRWLNKLSVPDDPATDKYTIVQPSPDEIWIAKGTTLYNLSLRNGEILRQIDFGEPMGSFGLIYPGQLWIEGKKSGLYTLDLDKPTQRPKRILPAKTQCGEINQVVPDENGKLFLGCSNGLFRLDTRLNSIRLIDGTAGFFIRRLQPSSTGSKKELWILTYNKGFSLWKDGKLTRYPLDRSGFLSSAHCFVEDKNGYAWIPTNKGLFQLKKDHLLEYADGRRNQVYYQYYDHHDGFKTNEFNGGCNPCSVRLPNGFVSLPSLKGLVYFNPEAIRRETSFGEVLIDRVISNGETRLLYSDTIQLETQDLDLTIPVRTAYFGNRYNLDIVYALMRRGKQPEKKDWIPLNERSEINIGHLDSGEYSLFISSRSENKTYSREVRLTMAPEWYLTAGMKVIYFFLMIGLILVVINYRVQVIIRRNRKLEEKVNFRTNELVVSLDQLKETHQELEWQTHLQDRLITSLVHDARTPLSALKMLAELNQQLLSSTSDSKLTTNNQLIVDSVSQILNMMDNVLIFIKTQVFERKIEAEQLSLFEILNRNIKICKISRRQNEFVNEIPADTSVYTVARILDIILYNLLDNSNKYSYKGRINIYAENETEDYIDLCIENDGTRIPEDILNWLTHENVRQPDWHNGVGLILIKQLAKIVNIRVSAGDSDRGTRLILRIPTKK